MIPIEWTRSSTSRRMIFPAPLSPEMEPLAGKEVVVAATGVDGCTPGPFVPFGPLWLRERHVERDIWHFEVRTAGDQAHVAARHIEQLRQLVELQRLQPLADRRDPARGGLHGFEPSYNAAKVK